MKKETVNFVVKFGMINEDAIMLNVLVEAKNGDICPYNLVHLEEVGLLVDSIL